MFKPKSLQASATLSEKIASIDFILVGAIVTLIFIDHKETPDHTDNLHTLPRKYQSPMLSRFKAQIQRKQEFDQLHANLLSDNEQMLSRANSNILVENNSLR